MTIRVYKKTIHILLIFLSCCIIAPKIYSQSDNIPVKDQVYGFLKRMQVQGIIKDYDDSILPLTRKQINHFLQSIELNSKLLDRTDIDYLRLLKRKFNVNRNSVGIFCDFPEHFVGNLLSDSLKSIYQYSDSNYSFVINPVLRYKYIYNNEINNNSNLFEFGGEVYGGYKDWFGFYIYGTNGIQSGSREAALSDKIVKHSYTFNSTGRNNFDFTLGYLNIVKEPFQIELGRDEILWGNGYIDKIIISNNAQPLDFIKFRFGYKSLSYTFLHAWLVQKPFEVPIDKNYGTYKSKNSKYLAISRLQFKPANMFQISASQLIIYSNRPLELSYLNPFLFWESAQRSLNDLDNSFLTLESRILPVKGLELSASMILDDINFENLFGGKWASTSNGSGWQLGGFVTYPFMWKFMDVKIDYTQFRPFLFSHPGLPGALTYTNNGELIGADLQPNSSRLSIETNFRVTSRISAALGVQYTLHGNNVLDNEGNILQNAGGDVFQPARVIDPEFVYLLKGDLEKETKIYSEIEYQFLLGYYLGVHISYYDLRGNPDINNDYVILRGEFRVSFN